MRKIKKAFLLCAGQGQRFAPHTDKQAKVLLPFLNLPLVAYNLFLLKSLGVQEVIANVHGPYSARLGERLKTLAQTVGLSFLQISYEESLLGSAGGLLQVRQFFETDSKKDPHNSSDEDFLYLNGDSLIEPVSLDSLLKAPFLAPLKKGVARFLCQPSQKKQGVLWAVSSGRVMAFGGDAQALSYNLKPDQKAYHFCGLALLSSRIFKHIPLGARHIFSDLLGQPSFPYPSYVYSLAHLKAWDMNQLSSYLDGTYQVLKGLLAGQQMELIRGTLDLFSPRWQILDYHDKDPALISANPSLKMNTVTKTGTAKAGTVKTGTVKNNHRKNILFTASPVQGLSYLRVRDFAVLGEHCQIMSPCTITKAVVGAGVLVNQDVSHNLFF